jgi:hypothetical protein
MGGWEQKLEKKRQEIKKEREKQGKSSLRLAFAGQKSYNKTTDFTAENRVPLTFEAVRLLLPVPPV